MRAFIIFVSFFTLGGYADFKDDLAKEYARGVNAILFFTSEDIISSGHYTFDALDATLESYFFPFKFAFKSDCDDYNYFLNGSIGFSDYNKNNIDFNRDTKDSFSLRTYALKLGGGTRFNTSPDTHINLGAAYIYSNVSGSYKTAIPLDTDDPSDKAIQEILGSDQNHHTFEVSSAFKYHPVIQNYKPYVSLGVRHIRTKVDDSYVRIPDIKSSISKLSMGVITPPVTEVFGMPLRLEPYASYIYLAGDIDNALDIDSFYVVGTTLRFGSYALTCWVEDVAKLKRDSMNWVKDLTLDMSLIKGDNFDGFNIGLGVRF